MKYTITANTDSWPYMPNGTRIRHFSDATNCNGKLKIEFSHGSEHKTYINDYVNIPLFLTELHLFIKDCEDHGSATWHVGFSPFAHGLMRDNSLLVSTVSGKFFMDNVYDAMDEGALSILKEKVRKDLLRYGSVETLQL